MVRKDNGGMSKKIIKNFYFKDDIVDEARLTDADGNGQQAFVGNRLDRFQIGEGKEIDIINGSHRFGFNFRRNNGFQLFYIFFAAVISRLGFSQAAGKDQGRFFFSVGQISIARAPGQTAFFTDDGDHIDVDGQVKVTDKTADDDDLLGIFLTEEASSRR